MTKDTLEKKVLDQLNSGKSSLQYFRSKQRRNKRSFRHVYFLN